MIQREYALMIDKRCPSACNEGVNPQDAAMQNELWQGLDFLMALPHQ